MNLRIFTPEELRDAYVNHLCAAFPLRVFCWAESTPPVGGILTAI